MRNGRSFVVIGGGIVGLACGLALQLRGIDICLIERDEPAGGASSGNAGYLSQGNIFPIASPATFKALPSLLLDQKGPLVIRPSYLPRLIPWGLALARASTPARSALAMAAVAALNHLAVAEYAPLLARADATDLIDVAGGLHLFRSPKTFDDAVKRLAIWEDHGIAAQPVGADVLLQCEPALSPDLAGAILFPGSARCRDPRALGVRFAEAIVAHGGQIMRANATGVKPRGDGWSVATDAGTVEADRILIAAGRWSDRLLAPLNYPVPLESERGYHLMLPDPGVALNHPLVAVENSFAITPMNDGIRLAGTVEFAALDAPMNPKRSDMLLDQARAYLPDLQGARATRWMGHRPSLPDSLPAIGRARAHPGLFYAFGHHHAGLTQAAITARLIADLATGTEPPVALAPFAIERFGKRDRHRPLTPVEMETP